VQVYWLGALAALLLGRLPSGVPPAWERGEAVPWPSTQELREQRIRDAEARRGGAPGDSEPEDAAAGVPSPATARRKRKKRR
jgi:hypothetical protein